MKILIVTQYFYPENFKSNDLAFELKKKGHDVMVLTGIPNYPEGKIYDGYGYFKKRKELINEVTVIRSLLLTRGNGNGVRLFLNYFSWAFFASLTAIKLSSKKFDAIIVHEPSPITQFYPALVLKKLQKTPVYFWVMDLWPESLEIAGGIKNRFILNLFTRMVRYFYKESEKILITSKGFKKSILEKGNFEHKIEYFPNWAEDTISLGNTAFPIPALPEGFKIMFAGNIGEAQDMDSIMTAALHLKGNQDVKFILVGDGRKMKFVKEFIKENHLEQTVYTLGRYPVEAMASFFKAADILLVSLKDDPIFNITVPAKVQAYMSSGKPILAMLNGEGAENIAEADCGFSVPAGDSEKLAATIHEISQMKKEDLSLLGNNGKKFYEANYKMEKCISNLERIISAK
jgi:glycosyltransferase involved in cell wall biosynthesis